MIEAYQDFSVQPMPPMGMDEPIEVAKPKKAHKLIAQLEEGNIFDKLGKMKDKTAAQVYEDIMQSYGDAEASNEKWLRKYKAALKLAKMQPTAGGEDIDTKDFPFPGASTAMMPFVMQAMLDFAARAAP